MYAPNYPFAPQQQHGANPNAPNHHQLTPQQQAYLQQQQQLRQSHSQSPHLSQQQHAQMMFNQQQGAQAYAGGAQQQGLGYGGGAGMGAGINTGSPQNPMGQQNPNLGMAMQSPAGMAHPAGAQAGLAGASYQTPYTASPYAASSVPTSNTSQGQFIPPTTGASQFSTPQRMSAPPMNASQQARNSPFGTPGQQHTTPPHNQFQTPGHSAQNSMSMPSPAMMAQAQAQQQAQGMAQQMQNQSGSQTPVTPSSAGGAQTQNQNTPISPGGEAREKERVSLLLEINRVLLMEVMKLQAAQAEAKTKAEKDTTDFKDVAEKPKIVVDPQMGKEFVECMRRIQYNLSYLAAIADRSHKPSSQTPPHPAIISAPQLVSIKNLRKGKEETKVGEIKAEEEEDGPEELKTMYARLQTLFPGVDPRKEPPVPMQGSNKPPPQNQAGGGAQSQSTPMQQAAAPSHGTPAGPGASGFGQGGLTAGQPLSGTGGGSGMSNLTTEQQQLMMQNSRGAQMWSPNRDFNAAQGSMGFNSGATQGGLGGQNHTGAANTMGSGSGGVGIPASTMPVGSGGIIPGTLNLPGGMTVNMPSNENRARMMAQMQQQMSGMTQQQRMEYMAKIGMSREALQAIGGGMRGPQAGQQGGMQGGQQGGMGGGMYRQ